MIHNNLMVNNQSVMQVLMLLDTEQLRGIGDQGVFIQQQLQRCHGNSSKTGKLLLWGQGLVLVSGKCDGTRSI
jgi:hypothetical protein